MNVMMNIDAMSGLVTFTVSGTVTSEGIIEALQDMLADRNFKKGASTIWDFRDADSSELATMDVRRIAAYMDRIRAWRGDGYKVAFVVARDADFGLARVYEGYAASFPFEIMVFRSMDEALSWVQT